MKRQHNRNYYLRIEAMQTKYLKHQNSGRSVIYTYRKFIHPQFYISRSTFYRWLTINPHKELTRLNITSTQSIN